MSPDQAGERPGDRHDLFGPLERSGAVRGVALVVLAVVIGLVLMPSATRGAPVSVTSNPPASLASGTAATTTTTVARAATTTTTTGPVRIPFGTIRVLVANGTNTTGAAGSVTSFLAGKGFSTLKAVNALTTVHATQLYVPNGATTAATEVAAVLGVPASAVQPASSPAPVSSVTGADVVVIVGPDILPRSTGTTTTG